MKIKDFSRKKNDEMLLIWLSLKRYRCKSGTEVHSNYAYSFYNNLFFPRKTLFRRHLFKIELAWLIG